MTNDNLVQRLRDSAQLSSLPQWVRDEFTQAADRIDLLARSRQMDASEFRSSEQVLRQKIDDLEDKLNSMYVDLVWAEAEIEDLKAEQKLNDG